MLRKKYNDSPEEGEQNILSILERVDIGAGELSDYIEQMADNCPSDEKLHRIWKKDINKLIDKFNQDFGKGYTRRK